MTTAKTEAKKRAMSGRNKNQADFYVVRTAREAVDSVADKLEDYGRKYVRNPLETGKKLARELKTDPKKAVGGALQDGQKRISEIRRDVRKKADEVLDGGKKFARDFNRDPRKAVDGLVEDGRDFFEDLKDETQDKLDVFTRQGRDLIKGVEGDIRKLLEELADTSQRLINKITLRETVEKRIKEQLDAMPKKMKVASKSDVLKLSAAVKGLTARVEELTRLAEAQKESRKDASAAPSK